MSPLSLSSFRSGSAITTVMLLAVAGCSKARDFGPQPAGPEAVVTSFMEAVSANRIAEMGALWGTSEGPAARTIKDPVELEQRLTVIRAYLVHERFEFVQNLSSIRTDSKERVLNVKLFRNGCEPVVPIKVIKYRRGWLIREIDLPAAGNPRERCQRRDSGGT